MTFIWWLWDRMNYGPDVDFASESLGGSATFCFPVAFRRVNVKKTTRMGRRDTFWILFSPIYIVRFAGRVRIVKITVFRRLLLINIGYSEPHSCNSRLKFEINFPWNKVKLLTLGPHVKMGAQKFLFRRTSWQKTSSPNRFAVRIGIIPWKMITAI